MNTRNTLTVHRIDTTRADSLRRWPRVLRPVLAAWLRLRIRWTQEEIDMRAIDGSLSPAQHRLWRECIDGWRSDLQFLEMAE